jgi:hypothetical protein
MSLSTSAAPEQAARDEELRGECAKAFAHYKQGNRTRGTQLLQKLLARHPAHPLLHYAHARLSHKLALEQRTLDSLVEHFVDSRQLAAWAVMACPGGGGYVGACYYY